MATSTVSNARLHFLILIFVTVLINLVATLPISSFGRGSSSSQQHPDKQAVSASLRALLKGSFETKLPRDLFPSALALALKNYSHHQKPSASMSLKAAEEEDYQGDNDEEEDYYDDEEDEEEVDYQNEEADDDEADDDKRIL